MEKLNLILDYNNLAMRSLFTCQFMEGVDYIKNFDTQEECNIFIRKLTIDITSIVRLFSPDNVIIVCDSKNPWRKKLYDEIDGETYKGNRKKDKEKNWDNIFKSIDDLKSIFKERGFIVSEIENAEADDLASLWSNYYNNKEKQNCILVSSDKDWTQLIRYNNETKSFILCYNPISNNKGKKKIYIDEDISEWFEQTEKVDILFENYSIVKKKIKNAIESDQKIIVEKIDPNMVILDKIMCGDDGDNVPSFFDYYKNGKKIRITPLKAKHIYESLNIRTLNDLIKSNDDCMLKDTLEKEMKCDAEIDFNKRMERQRKMVELNPSLFPDNIVNKFNDELKSLNETSSLDYSKMKLEYILKDTQYVDENYVKGVRNNSIFNDLDILNRFYKKDGKLF